MDGGIGLRAKYTIRNSAIRNYARHIAVRSVILSIGLAKRALAIFVLGTTWPLSRRDATQNVGGHLTHEIGSPTLVARTNRGAKVAAGMRLGIGLV